MGIELMVTFSVIQRIHTKARAMDIMGKYIAIGTLMRLHVYCNPHQNSTSCTEVGWGYQHIEAETKRALSHRRHFQVHFLWRKMYEFD